MLAENKPTVSVVTPFLDAEPFIEEAIESVLAQTYQSWELLLVDDGATDGSSEIAQRFATRYPDRIRYLSHPDRRNLGKSVSRNLGIQSGRGEYLALLDADDVLLPQKLAHQVAKLEAHPGAVMVYGPTFYWYGWSGKTLDQRRDRRARLGVRPATLYQPPHLLTQFLRDPGIVPCTCGLLARRSEVIAVGCFDDSIQALYEDQVLLAKLCLRGAVYVDDGCWDLYRQHDDSSSAQAIRAQAYHPFKPNPARKAYLDWLGGYLDQHDIWNMALRNAHHRSLWPYRNPTLYRTVSPLHFLFAGLGGRLSSLFRRQLVPYSNAVPR